LPHTELSDTARQRLNISRRTIQDCHRRNGADLKHLQRIHLRASLMPAVAVTSAQGAYAYIVALKGFSVGCQPSFLLISVATGKTMGAISSEFSLFSNHPRPSFCVSRSGSQSGRDLRYKTESTTVICAFFLKKKTSRSDSFSFD
jgi:hypothetical protein